MVCDAAVVLSLRITYIEQVKDSSLYGVSPHVYFCNRLKRLVKADAHYHVVSFTYVRIIFLGR
jgi:hypothetical protein